jgi:FAD-linked sulfhydryl oxidase
MFSLYRAELGRATWKLLHTMMARFPEKPTPDDSMALKTFITLFSRLYPCGDCAAHFRKLLQKYPPQTSSRQAAAGWACFVHNEVNTRLHKELFDCNKIGDFYDCGCGEDDKDKGKKAGKGGEELKGRENISVEKEEGLTRGG